MKKLFVAAIMLLAACSNQNANYVINDNHYAVFEFDCVEDVTYSEEDGCFTIEYCDPDAFDLDNLAYMTGRKHWYGDYIAVDIEDSIVHNFLNDWKKWLMSDYETKYELSESWCIQVIWITFSDGSKDIRFEMIHQSWESAEENV